MTGDEITYGGQAETRTTNDLGTPYTAPRCHECGADEFDVFDTEHTPHSCRTLREFYANAEKLTELDDAGTLPRLIVLGTYVGTSTSLDDLETHDYAHYVGQYSTFQDYAEQLANDIELLRDMPQHLTYYFDYEKWAADIQHDYYYDTETGHTWYTR
jgi:antirestriction protein